MKNFFKTYLEYVLCRLKIFSKHGFLNGSPFLPWIFELSRLIDMINIICTHVFVISFLPSKWKFVSDTVCKCLRFCKSVSRIDPRCFSCVMIDEIHFSIKILCDVPPFRKRYLPIPSPWHISLRSKSIQNSLSPTSRQAHICAREHILPVPHTRSLSWAEWRQSPRLQIPLERNSTVNIAGRQRKVHCWYLVLRRYYGSTFVWEHI